MSNNRIPENHESSNLYYLEQKKEQKKKYTNQNAGISFTL